MRKHFYIGPLLEEYTVFMIFYIGESQDRVVDNIVEQHMFSITGFDIVHANERSKGRARKFAKQIAVECPFKYYTLDMHRADQEQFLISDPNIYTKEDLFK